MNLRPLRSAFLTWILGAEGCVEGGAKAWSAISSSGSKTCNKYEATINHYLTTCYSSFLSLGNSVKTWDKSSDGMTYKPFW